MGARSQAAKTYLERGFEGYRDTGVDELIKHSLRALHATLGDEELTSKNCTVAVVSLDMPFTIIEEEGLQPYLEEALQEEEEGGGGGGDVVGDDDAGGEEGAAPMED